MIDRLKPYPAYKDSGVPWLGEVPAHWEVRRTKTLFQSRKQLNTDGSETNVLSLTLRGVVNNDPDNPEGLVPKDYKTYQIFERDDLVFKLIDLENVRTSRVGLVHERGIMSSAYVRLTLSGMGEVRFYYQQFYDLYQRSIYNQIGEGVRSTIGWSDLANLRILAPPLPEQTAIVRFLDYMDRQIRRYIRAKQKLIKLLEEYKQALIHQSVTGKIDVRTGQPYPAYKPSGVEWLGDVPEHWEVVPIKRAFSSMDYGISESGSDSGTIRLLTMGHLKNGQVIIPDTGGVDTVDPNLLLSPGDLLFNRTNSAELVGKVALFSGYESPVTFASYLVRMRPTKENEPEFLNLVLNDASTLSRARREAIPSLHQSNLNPTRYGRLCIALPPKAEQQAILQRLREQTENIDTAIASARCKIKLLREYRTRLIADVVTGKLDVREVAARLPEEPPEEKAEWMDTDETAEGEAADDAAAAEVLSEEEVEP